jgi:hypothetical protein
MDLLADIKRKAEKVPESERPGIAAVIRHLEQAERFLEGGRLGEDDLFTDVVYRTNHAYEGALKEAFEKLTGKESSRRTPHDIENYFEKNSILRSRVLDLMRNYRQDWRNPSTHEYELFFNGQEALLAIITVSAFVALLLDQIVDQLAARQQALRSEAVKKVSSALADYRALSLGDQTVTLIQSFVSSLAPTAEPDQPASTESYLETAIANFLRDIAPALEVALEPEISTDIGVLRPDIVVRKEKETVVIEVKRAMRRGVIREATVLRVLSYAKALNAMRAIIVYMPNGSTEMSVETKLFSTMGVPITVTEIFPKP